MTRDDQMPTSGLTGLLTGFCTGCRKIKNDRCTVYLYPLGKWNAGGCMFNTKAKVEEKAKKLNPIKASKKKGR